MISGGMYATKMKARIWPGKTLKMKSKLEKFMRDMKKRKQECYVKVF